jgi:hypothetical protein
MTSPALDSSAVWSAVASPVQVTGTVFTVTVPLDTNSSAFYRLQSN